MNNKIIYFLEGKLIKLRHILHEDLEVIYQWYNSDKFQQTTTHHRFPNTIEMQQKYYERQFTDHENLDLAVIKGEVVVGTITLLNINHLDQKAELSIHIFDTSKDKTRVALEAVTLLVEHGFYQLNLNKIYTGVMEGLLGWSTLLVDFLGFAREGKKREDVYKEGRFHDVLMLSLLKTEYESKKGKK